MIAEAAIVTARIGNLSRLTAMTPPQPPGGLFKPWQPFPLALIENAIDRTHLKLSTCRF
jgi:hypothetical protein